MFRDRLGVFTYACVVCSQKRDVRSTLERSVIIESETSGCVVGRYTGSDWLDSLRLSARGANGRGRGEGKEERSRERGREARGHGFPLLWVGWSATAVFFLQDHIRT